ncbi:Undecaprenyl-phosphate galactose phosphotransferase [candidate division TM7 genomosp. GTL1]|nr:Undecaprenyl-phosphate galactose phosphotransferase [candidate division TM7 genomosp. GTL1]
MPRRNTKFFSIILILADIMTLLVAFMLAYISRTQFDSRPLVNEVYAIDFFLTFLSIVPFWIIVFASLDLYNQSVYSRRMAEVSRLFIGSSIGILIMLGYAFIIDKAIFPARLVAIYVFIGSFLFLVVERRTLHGIRSLLFRFGLGINRVLVVGNSPVTSDIALSISDTKRSGYQVVAIAGPKKVVPAELDVRHFTSLQAALNKIDTLGITTIIQTDLFEDHEKNEQILDAAQTHHINYSFIPGESEFYAGKNTVDVFLGYPMISVSQTPLTGWGVVVKRIFDVVLTTLIIIILSPLYILLIILQKLFNPGPVFYKSKRLTRFSHPFECYKFRSMNPRYGSRDAADEFRAMGREDLAREYEAYRKVKNDPRITWFGAFLRRTSLDELPQFFNVLKGDLSLVGPRAILPQEMSSFRKSGALLHSVKSGVTGLWQVSGRSNLTFEQRVELELYYAQNWSFWLDLKILFRTIKVVFTRDGAQ